MQQPQLARTQLRPGGLGRGRHRRGYRIRARSRQASRHRRSDDHRQGRSQELQSRCRFHEGNHSYRREHRRAVLAHPRAGRRAGKTDEARTS